MKIRCMEFQHGAAIPRPFTCLGANVNPSLVIEGVPAGTKSLVLVFEDVDATPTPWTHWLLFNMRPDTTVIPQGTIPRGATEALANNHSFGYEGPCPTYFNGTHHYWFRLYAVDIELDLPAASEREAVERAMQGHVVEEAELLGLCTSTEVVAATK